jgi:hypothetical protein
VVRDAETGRKHADKLARVWSLENEPFHVMIHIEVQSDKRHPESVPPGGLAHDAASVSSARFSSSVPWVFNRSGRLFRKTLHLKQS